MPTENETLRPAPGFEYGPLRDAAELDAHIRATRWCFSVGESDCGKIFERMGTDCVRVLRSNGSHVGGLSLYSAGQWFGGRSVPMAAIGLVGIAPESRGLGVATNLMNACVLDARARGLPISALYPAKQTLYRRSGWELAGGCWGHRAPTSAFGVGERSPEVRPLSDSDQPAVREIHRRVSVSRHGELDRDDYLWLRVTSHLKHDIRGFGVEGSDGLEGYVFLHELDNDEDYYDLVVSDLAFTTETAARRIFRFLADHSTLARDVRWNGAPIDPVLGLMREQKWKTALRFHWMLRLCDVPAALEARGWPDRVEAEVPLDVEDEVVPENRGRFLLEVAGGRARVRSGGSGGLRVHVRDLASLYSGWMTPAQGRLLGRIECDDTSLEAATRVFAAPTPWMTDMF